MPGRANGRAWKIRNLGGMRTMQERTDQTGDGHPVPAVSMGTPGEGLRAYLVPGNASTPERVGLDGHVGTLAELAVRLADLAARVALIDPESLPPGVRLYTSIGLQPWARDLDLSPAEAEAAEVATVDAVAAVLLPGIEPRRRTLHHGGEHFGAKGCTPAGLNVAILAQVAPAPARTADVAEAEAAALATDAAVSRDDTEMVTEATRLGHVMVLQPAGRMDEPGYVAAVCSCKDRTDPTTPDRARRAWRLHALAVVNNARHADEAAELRHYGTDVVGFTEDELAAGRIETLDDAAALRQYTDGAAQ